MQFKRLKTQTPLIHRHFIYYYTKDLRHELDKKNPSNSQNCNNVSFIGICIYRSIYELITKIIKFLLKIIF